MRLSERVNKWLFGNRERERATDELRGALDKSADTAEKVEAALDTTMDQRSEDKLLSLIRRMRRYSAKARNGHARD